MTPSHGYVTGSCHCWNEQQIISSPTNGCTEHCCFHPSKGVSKCFFASACSSGCHTLMSFGMKEPKMASQHEAKLPRSAASSMLTKEENVTSFFWFSSTFLDTYSLKKIVTIIRSSSTTSTMIMIIQMYTNVNTYPGKRPQRCGGWNWEEDTIS